MQFVEEKRANGPVLALVIASAAVKFRVHLTIVVMLTERIVGLLEERARTVSELCAASPGHGPFAVLRALDALRKAGRITRVEGGHRYRVTVAAERPRTATRTTMAMPTRQQLMAGR
jgi:hypothetical protein